MATTLTYTESDFEPFTKILASAANSKFNDIKSRLNWDGTTATTGLGDDNVQSNTVSNGGLTRSTKLKAGTASYVVINDSNGKMSEEVTLASSRGGLGFAPTLSAANAGKGVVVNDAGNALALGTPSVDRLTESLASDVTTLTAGEAISANDAVCIDLHNGTESSLYRVFKCDSDLPNRRYNFLGFATAAATVTAGIYTWTDSAALVAGNTVAWSINGRSYTQAFSADNDTTLAAVATQIAADPDVASATVTDAGANDRVITITSRGGLSLNISGAAVTGGASQATIAIANTQAPSGQSVNIRCFGPMSGFVGLTVGANYYLSGTAGSITTSPSDTSPIFVGQALSSTVMFVNRNVGSFQFTTPSILVRALGGSTGETAANAQANSEHFNFTSWSSGTSDAAGKFSMQSGESTLGGYLVAVDGKDTGGTNALSLRKYNKTSWAAGTNRTTARVSGGIGQVGSTLAVANGSPGGGAASATAAVDVYNGSTWTAGAATLSNTAAIVSCFVQGSKTHYIGDVSAVDRHDTFDGASAATATTGSWGASMQGGAAATGSTGISGTLNSATNTKSWNGSSWSSAIVISYTPYVLGAGTTITGPATGYNSGNACSYSNGGNSAATTSVTTTSRYNGSTWTSDTASSTARAGGVGGVF